MVSVRSCHPGHPGGRRAGVEDRTGEDERAGRVQAEFPSTSPHRNCRRRRVAPRTGRVLVLAGRDELAVAVTTSAESRLSTVSPYSRNSSRSRREGNRRCPARHQPPVTQAERLRLASNSAQVSPACATAAGRSVDPMPFIEEMSMITRRRRWENPASCARRCGRPAGAPSLRRDIPAPAWTSRAAADIAPDTAGGSQLAVAWS